MKLLKFTTNYSEYCFCSSQCGGKPKFVHSTPFFGMDCAIEPWLVNFYGQNWKIWMWTIPGGNLRSAQCWPSTDCRRPSTGVCTAPALGQYWFVMLGCTGCAVLETSTDSVLSNHWHTIMPDLSFLYHWLSTASIVEPIVRQYWVNCRLSLLVNCTRPVLRRWWTPAEYRNFHLGFLFATRRCYVRHKWRNHRSFAWKVSRPSDFSKRRLWLAAEIMWFNTSRLISLGLREK